MTEEYIQGERCDAPGCNENCEEDYFSYHDHDSVENNNKALTQAARNFNQEADERGLDVYDLFNERMGIGSAERREAKRRRVSGINKALAQADEPGFDIYDLFLPVLTNFYS